ncbi:MAG TPA: hypothetical protein VK395_27535 [Gemmataceae bacterium]|nr:hypothetical protein [Gemmataceae bacterium]
MPERDSHQLRVKKLLAQDQDINDIQLKEFRMQLEQSLESWEQKSKRTRRRILIALAAYLAGMIICRFLAVLWDDAAPSYASAVIRTMILWLFAITALAAALTGIWLLALYVFKYAPGLKRARFDVQTSMTLELQEQVKQLREEMRNRE